MATNLTNEFAKIWREMRRLRHQTRNEASATGKGYDAFDGGQLSEETTLATYTVSDSRIDGGVL